MFQVSDVLGETSMGGGAALRRPRVGRGRGTVTGLVTAARMTDTGAARATWSAGATTASSLELTSIPRMTVVKTQTVVEVRNPQTFL